MPACNNLCVLVYCELARNEFRRPFHLARAASKNAQSKRSPEGYFPHKSSLRWFIFLHQNVHQTHHWWLVMEGFKKRRSLSHFPFLCKMGYLLCKLLNLHPYLFPVIPEAHCHVSLLKRVIVNRDAVGN